MIAAKNAQAQAGNHESANNNLNNNNNRSKDPDATDFHAIVPINDYPQVRNSLEFFTLSVGHQELIPFDLCFNRKPDGKSRIKRLWSNWWIVLELRSPTKV
jgi:hypothetical protein